MNLNVEFKFWIPILNLNVEFKLKFFFDFDHAQDFFTYSSVEYRQLYFII